MIPLRPFRPVALPRRPLLLGAATATFVTTYLVAPTDDGPVTCLLRRHTGLPCPGCGMSRAVGRLVHGEPAAAMAYHPYVVVLAAQALALMAWLLVRDDRPLSDRQRSILAWSITANAVALVVVWAVRLATGQLDHVL